MSPLSPHKRPSDQVVKTLQLAFMAFQAGRIGEAEGLFQQVLSEDPAQFDALHLLAVINAQRGDYPKGLQLISAALAVNPHSAEAYINQGRMQAESHEFAAAAESYRQAIRLNPQQPLARSNFAAVLISLGEKEEALSEITAAVTLAPNYADAWHNRGNILFDMGRFEEACASYEKALACGAARPDAVMGLALGLEATGKYVEAVSAFERALQLRPSQPYALGHRLYSKMQICDWATYKADAQQLDSAVRASTSVCEPFFFLAVSSSPADQMKCAADYVNEKFPQSSSSPAFKRSRRDKIRLAYLSADFRDHAVASLIAGVFELHDRSRFEVNGVSFGPDSTGAMRRRLVSACDRFIDVRLQNDQSIAETIRSLEIDIAVDFSGFTKDCRPGILAKRPAPVQVNYLGYPGTMGAPYIDYIIADRVVIPPSEQQFYSEKVVYLPDSYQSNDHRRARPALRTTKADEGLPHEGFVFCSFNNTYKLTPSIFDVWMRLLRRADGSVLWLLEGNEVAVRNLRSEAEIRGVSADRLVFARRVALEDHLARHQLADLFLDTLPYNAHTTASDALWMGLPVVTCEGSTFAGRVAASLLHATGLPNLVTRSLADYETLALRLAQDRSLLDSLRQRICDGRDRVPLFDTARTTRHLEVAYVRMHERSLMGEGPIGFAVEPPSDGGIIA